MTLRLTEDEYRALVARTSGLTAKMIGVELKQRTESKLEIRLAQQLVEAGITSYQRNYFFLSDRDFELDFAWPNIKIAIEVQGMSHRIKGKFTRDIEKRALAMLAGWRVLEVDGAAVRSGKALEWLRVLLRREEVEALPF